VKNKEPSLFLANTLVGNINKKIRREVNGGSKTIYTHTQYNNNNNLAFCPK
jgi:hypothetical protein